VDQGKSGVIGAIGRGRSNSHARREVGKMLCIPRTNITLETGKGNCGGLKRNLFVKEEVPETKTSNKTDSGLNVDWDDD